MQHPEKAALRLAVTIHDHLIQESKSRQATTVPDTAWQTYRSLTQRVQRAHRQGWLLAADRLQRDLTRSLQRLQSELTGLLSASERASPAKLASARDIYHDILSLRDDFSDVKWDVRGLTLAVTTPSITLEGVELGSFQIELDWCQLTAQSPYRIIALDPNPATTNESVTHPHVEDEALCEGDGRQPISNALQQGRLADFFLIVQNILYTYNPDSPYVALDRWDGFTCNDCGTSVGADDRICCDRCGNDVCSECYTTCPKCSEYFCAQCLMSCEVCEDYFCRRCLDRCSACGLRVCPECLIHNEICKACHEANEEQEDPVGPIDSASVATQDHVTLRPHGVGQVAVPA